MNVDARVEALEAENERLLDRVEELERLLGMDVTAVDGFPVEWGLTGSERRVLGFMATKPAVTKEGVMMALYSDRPNEEPEIKIVDVFICKIRKKVSRFGVVIETLWGQGYRLDQKSRDMISRLVDAARAEVA